MRIGLNLGLTRGGAVSAGETDLIMTVQTTGASETFTLGASSGTYSAVVDWGDDSTSDITSNTDPDLTHTYVTPGTYTIRISGTYPALSFNNSSSAPKVRTVENLGKIGWISAQSAFYGCSGMTRFVAGNNDLVDVVGVAMSNFLRSCSSLSDLDLSGLNGFQPGNISSFFFTCPLITALDLSSWNMSSHTGSMANVFRAMTGLTSLTLPAVFVNGATTALSSMFEGDTSLGSVDCDDWDTSGCTNFTSAFRTMGALTVNIAAFDLSAMTTCTNFMLGTTLATADYDAALIAFDAADVPNSFSMHFGSSTYTGGGAAASARAGLIANDLWTITDGGTA